MSGVDGSKYTVSPLTHPCCSHHCLLLPLLFCASSARPRSPPQSHRNIVSSSHPPTLSSSHPRNLSSSQPLSLSSAQALIHLPSHPLILSSSHPLILSPSHLLILPSSHPLILNSAWTPVYIAGKVRGGMHHPFPLPVRQCGPCTRVMADPERSSAVIDAQMCVWAMSATCHLCMPSRRAPAMAERLWSPSTGRPFQDYAVRCEPGRSAAARAARCTGPPDMPAS
jgi:hypothetical protein